MSDPTALPNFPPPADEHPLRGRVLDALQDLGLQTEIDADGDIAFDYQDQRLFVRSMDGETATAPGLLLVFGQWQITEPAPTDVLQRLQRCNDFTLGYKVIKTALIGDLLFVGGEHIVLPETDLHPILGMTIDVMLQVVQAWFQSWLPEEERSAFQPPEDPQP